MSYYRRRSAKNPRQRGYQGARLIIALGMALFALFSYFSSRTFNPVTEETQYINITADQEIALGLQAAPQMVRQHGGVSQDATAQATLERICERLIRGSEAGATSWPFACTLLADRQTINAFALPGGQMYMTTALWERLTTEGQIAAVMAHEMGHVVARHGAQRIAKAELTQGLSGAAVLAAYDPSDPRSAQAAQVAAVIGQLVNMKYGREDELQSDALGVQFLAEAGYDPRALLVVMRVLAEASNGNRQPEFFSTHPNPENRIGEIERAIALQYPGGVPAGLDP